MAVETGTLTLSDFILARLAEDEAEAHDAIRERDRVGFKDCGPDMQLQSWPDVGVPAVLVGAERVLADVEAKRRIVEREAARLHQDWRRRIDEHRQTFDEWFQKPYGMTLRDLGSVYADHPDYRDEWRP